jgi:hypothetical protein
MDLGTGVHKIKRWTSFVQARQGLGSPLRSLSVELRRDGGHLSSLLQMAIAMERNIHARSKQSLRALRE